MPALAAQVDAPSDSWVASGPTNAAYVYSTVSVHIPWSTGSPDTIKRGDPALVLPGLANTVDLGSGPWLICTAQGTGKAYLVLESSAATLDTVFSGAGLGTSTLILRRRFRGFSVDWQA